MSAENSTQTGLPTEFSQLPEGQVSPELAQSVASFEASLNDFATRVPEIDAGKEALQTAGTELIESFGIKPELFESPYRSMIFTSVSSRLAKLNESEPSQAGQREREFIADAAFLLSREFTDEYPELRAELEAEDNPSKISEETRLALFDKYTDKEYTKELEQAIENGLFDEVKQRLGITPDNETPYTVRVLSIGSGASVTHGLETPYPDLPEGWTDLPADDRNRLIRDASDFSQSGTKWKDGLAKRGEELRKALGEENIGDAWVSTTSTGEKHLCVALPLVEKILHRDELASPKNYSDSYYEDDMAVFEHEYTHTQQTVIDRKLGNDFGVTIAERHAEYFSKDQLGYQDVKRFFTNINLASGVGVADLFEGLDAKGRDAAELTEDFANRFGLGSVVELMAVMPRDYAKFEKNPIRQSIHKYLGGYDGVVSRIYQERVKQGDMPEIQRRVGEYAKRILDVNYDFWTPEQFEATQKMFGTAFLREEMKAELVKQRKATYKDKLKSVNFKQAA